MLESDIIKDRLQARALSVLQKIDDDRVRFDALDDKPGQRIHSLFAGLYGCTTRAWLTYLCDHPRPEFAYLVVLRFYDLYSAIAQTDSPKTLRPFPRHWQAYFGAAARQTHHHAISSHLLLISLAARAHTRHDLAEAICLAHQDYEQIFGVKPDLSRYRETVVSAQTDAAFRDAALAFIDMHHRDQKGWRRLVLGAFDSGIRFLRIVWLPVFQSWRKAAWQDACGRIRERALQPRVSEEHPCRSALRAAGATLV